MKIITIVPTFFPGVSSVFSHMEKVIGSKNIFVNLLKEEDLESCDLVIFGAWDNSYNEWLPKIKCKKGILWTSSILQAELSPESVEIKIYHQLLRHLAVGTLDYLFIGDKKLFATTDSEKIKFFPYPIHLDTYSSPLNKWDEGVKNIGLFTVSHARKNRMNQYEGFQLARRQNKDLILYTNSYILKGDGVVTLPWMEKEAYEVMMDKIHIGLNVFLSESFCYSFLQLMAKGIPTICSLTIAFNFGFPEYISEKLVVFDCDDCVEISEKINGLVKLNKEEMVNLSSDCIAYIQFCAEQNNRQLKELFNNL